MTSTAADAVAIVGAGCRFPGGAAGPDAFWRLLRDGTDVITEVPPSRWDLARTYDPDPDAPGRSYARWGGFLPDVTRFDAGFFGIAPREARQIDPQQRLLIEVAWEALEDAGIVPGTLAGTRTSVWSGGLGVDYFLRHAQEAGRNGIDPWYASGKEASFGPGRLSYLLGLNGPSVALSTACSSSLVAAHLARQSLLAGESDTALVAGVNVLLAPELTIFMSKVGAMARDGRCKTFDASADGIVRGDGCVVLVLKRLSDALADGDRVIAVVRGSAVNHDGHSAGLTVPSAAAQQALLRDALASAGAAPADIGFVEAHGTGTPLGDPLEMSALARVLGEGRDAEHPLLVGSLKTNFGHTDAAAGAAGLLKAALAVRHGQIPPHLHLRRPTPAIRWDRWPVRVPTELTDWPQDTPRLAGVSAFGLSGTNAHVVVEAPPERAPAADSGARSGAATRVLALSARSGEALRALARAHRDRLHAEPDADAAPWTAGAARLRTHHAEHRLAVTGATRAELAARLADFLDAPAPADDEDRPLPDEDAERLPVCFVFSGQGGQWPGMGRELLTAEPVFAAALAEVDAAVREEAGWSPAEELTAAPGRSRLTDTAVAQPVVFALQVAAAALWRSWGIEPAAVIGHSMGEIAAAHVAGALSLPDAVRIVVHRGRLLHRSADKGRMAAVALPEAELLPLLARFGDDLALAAVNGPSSSVVSGTDAAVTSLTADLAARGVTCRDMPGGYAFHSPQMAPHQAELTKLLADLRPAAPAVPVLRTSGAVGEGAEAAFDADYWGRNVREPVRFADAMARALDAGHRVFLEIGPHPVLAQPIVQAMAAAGVEGQVVPTLRRDTDAVRTSRAALAELYAAGAEIAWREVEPDPEPARDLPRYPWQGEPLWFEVPEGARGEGVAAADAATGPMSAATEAAAATTAGTAAAYAANGAPEAAAGGTGPNGTAYATRAAGGSGAGAPATGAWPAAGATAVGAVAAGDTAAAPGPLGAALPGELRGELRLFDAAGNLVAESAELRLRTDGQPAAVPAQRRAAAPAPAHAASAEAPAVTPRMDNGALADLVASAAAKVLGLASAAKVGRARGFSDLGMDSLGAVELCKVLERSLGLRLPKTAAFDHPTVQRLAAHLGDLLDRQQPAPAAPAALAPAAPAAPEPIAIVGVGCRFPGAADGPDAYWRLLTDAEDAVTRAPEGRFDDSRLWWGGFLADADGFDAPFFRIPPREAKVMDPQQRMFLEVAWEALEHAGIPPAGLEGSRTGVFLGINSTDYAQRVAARSVDAFYGTGTSFSAAAGRLSYLLGLRGPSIAVDTACSSSLVAIHLAAASLRRGESDLAVAAGVNLILDTTIHRASGAAGALAADGRCKTFDAAADGYTRGEGCGAVVLKPLSAARRDGDRVLALVLGSAVNQDGASSGFTAPNGPAQEELLRTAFADARVTPADLDYVEAHGTGTPLGDPIELRALGAALSERPAGLDACLVGSVKTNIGHLEAASGIAGVIKTVLALHHEALPAHLHFHRPSPDIPWSELPLRVPTRLRPWRRGTRRRVAGVSAFGFSGTNAHVVLAEAPQEAGEPGTGSRGPAGQAVPPDATASGGRSGAPGRPYGAAEVPAARAHAPADGAGAAGSSEGAAPTAEPASGGHDHPATPGGSPSASRELPSGGAEPASRNPERPHVLALSAASARSLRARAAAHRDLLAGTGAPEPADLAATLALRRSHLDHRLVVVGSDRAELAERLDAFAEGRDAPGTAFARAAERARGPVFVFSGHGSYWPGMAQPLAHRNPAFREALAACDRALSAFLDWSPAEVIAAGTEPADELDRQILLFAVQYALVAAWRDLGVEPAAVVGHSMGEVSAALCAGVLELPQAAEVMVRRTRLLRALVGQGGMAVVGLDADQTEHEIAPYGRRLCVAIVNSRASTVVSGESAALKELGAGLKQRNVFFRAVDAGGPAHSPWAEPLRAELVEALTGRLRPAAPKVPMYSSVDGALVAARPLDAAYWGDNLRLPVRFADAVRAAAGDGHDTFVELSAHPIQLTPIEQELRAEGTDGLLVPSLLRRVDGEVALLTAFGALHAGGATVDWRRLHPSPGAPVTTPAYPWEHRRYWVEDRPAVVGTGGGHPLTARTVRAGGATVVECDLDADLVAALGGDAGPQVPAAAWLELAVAAARTALGPGRAVRLTDVAFDAPLPLPADGTATVQLVLTRAADAPGAHRFAITAPDGARTLTLATGTARPSGPREAAPALPRTEVDAGVRERIAELAAPAEVVGAWSEGGRLAVELRCPPPTMRWHLTPAVVELALRAARFLDAQVSAKDGSAASGGAPGGGTDALAAPALSATGSNGGSSARTQEPRPANVGASGGRTNGAADSDVSRAGGKGGSGDRGESSPAAAASGGAAAVNGSGARTDGSASAEGSPAAAGGSGARTKGVAEGPGASRTAANGSDGRTNGSSGAVASGAAARSASAALAASGASGTGADSAAADSPAGSASGVAYDATALPVAIGAVTVHAVPGEHVILHIGPAADGDPTTADVLIADPDGRPLVDLAGIRSAAPAGRPLDQDAARRYAARVHVPGWEELPADLAAPDGSAPRGGQAGATAPATSGATAVHGTSVGTDLTAKPAASARRGTSAAADRGTPAGTATPALGTLLLVADAGGVGEALAAALEERGASPRIVRSGPATTLRERLAAALKELGAGEGCAAVVHLAGLDLPAGLPDPAGIAQACAAAAEVTGAVAAAGAGARLWWVTRGAVAVDDLEEAGPGPAALRRAAVVAGVEQPTAWGGALDLDPLSAGPAADAAAVLAEIERRLTPDQAPEDRIALRAGRRLAERVLPAPAAPALPPPLRLDAGRSYLVAGAAGPLAEQVTTWLTARGAGQVVGVPQVEDAGHAAKLITGQDLPVGGVVWLGADWNLPAGGTPDADALEAALTERASGAWLLHQACQETGTRPELFQVWSTVAGSWGAIGAGAQAPVDAALTALVAHRRARGLPATSVAWAPWGEVGRLDRDSAQRLNRSGMTPLTTAEGTELLDQVTAFGPAAVEIADVDWGLLLPLYRQALPFPLFDVLAARNEAAPGDADALLERLRALPAEGRAELVLECVLEEVAVVLGLDGPDELEPRQGFFELGLNSITALEMKVRLERRFGCPLPATLAFEHPNGQALAAFLATEALGADTPPAAGPTDRAAGGLPSGGSPSGSATAPAAAPATGAARDLTAAPAQDGGTQESSPEITDESTDELAARLDAELAAVTSLFEQEER
ncbi:type I polyketide synthase [Actinacidiphila guanduensis]|uniref:Acyl transferase domain-containing protein n=1 Tax=Actinacidiphila guanduensis TaxID=310781 RepID=A0A1H0BS22_9ACTN|nr:type I polyketide synthase [Actinacidiphila guanduensis]SDN48448.1 Acyl transferase domain-containing protein [Actinacidiphila guanduensis]